MVFNFNPLLKTKVNNDTALCSCKYRSPRNLYFETLKLPDSKTILENSVCSSDATKRGEGQKVISFSIFGKNNLRYIQGLIKNIEAIKKYYPRQYIIRLYFDKQRMPNKNLLCGIYCEQPILDLCDINNIGKIFSKFFNLEIPK